jgi:hypothetical protein
MSEQSPLDRSPSGNCSSATDLGSSVSTRTRGLVEALMLSAGGVPFLIEPVQVGFGGGRGRWMTRRHLSLQLIAKKEHHHSPGGEQQVFLLLSVPFIEPRSILRTDRPSDAIWRAPRLATPHRPFSVRFQPGCVSLGIPSIPGRHFPPPEKGTHHLGC